MVTVTHSWLAWKGKTDGSGFLLDWNAAGASDEANLFRRAAFRNRFRYAQKGMTNDSICVCSFALKPEEHQPFGTCNFSRIDNAQLIGEIKPNKRGLSAFKKQELIYDQQKLPVIGENFKPASYSFLNMPLNMSNTNTDEQIIPYAS